MDFAKFLWDNKLRSFEVAEFLEISEASISKWRTGKADVSRDKLRKLLSNPYGWDTSALTDNSTSIKASATGNATINMDSFNTIGIGQAAPMQPVPQQQYKTIPLIPLEAHAGSLGDYTEGVSVAQCERIMSPISAATCAIRITGDSMSPKYPSGSIVFLSKINEKAFIEWGRCYVLDTDNGAVIKMIRKSDNDNQIICESLNPEYLPFEVNTEYVKGWYKVIGVLQFE